MKILVLGATGFIGGHIAKQAHDKGWSVRCLRRSPNARGHLGDLNVEWVTGDLYQPNSLESAMENVDIVFHAAAFYPQDGNPRKVAMYQHVAKEEISNVINACRKAKVDRLVYTSTLTTIGLPKEQNRLADERDFYVEGTLAKSAYYETKILMEKEVLKAANSNLDCVILNPTAVFGPGDVHLTMAGLVRAIAKGWIRFWLPGYINPVDVRDAAAGHILAAVHGKRGERYILGGENLTIKDFITQTALIAGKKPPFFQIPLPVIDMIIRLSDLFPFLGIPTNHLRGIRLWQPLNTEKARLQLGYESRPFKATIESAIKWLYDNALL